MDKRITIMKTSNVTVSFPGDVIGVVPGQYIARLEVDLDDYSTLVVYAFEDTEEESRKVVEERSDVYLRKLDD